MRILTSKDSVTSNRTNNFAQPFSRLSFWIGVIGVAIGLVAGWLAGDKPLYLVLLLGAPIALFFFFAEFELA
ncbi:MAG: hypothetical protein ACRC11_10275, partial [Xenococcaceae cyanobacterium]